MPKEFKLTSFILAAALLLAACATMTPPATFKVIPWATRQAALKQVTTWQLDGEVAVRDATEAHSASIAWHQSPSDYHISLFGPLGLDRTDLVGTNQQVTLTTKGKQYQAKTPEALLKAMLGWSLPVTPLHDWIRGLPTDLSIQHIVFDEYHHVTELQQSGWTIDYLAYQSVGHVDLPTKIRFTKGNLKLIWVIGSWQLNPTSNN